MQYELKHDPIPFITGKASPIAQLSLLEALGLAESSVAKGLSLTILRKQNPDGGWPNQFDHRASGLKATYTTALLLLRCGMPAESVSIQGALRFILKKQRPDGGFAESGDIPIPDWMTWESSEKSVTYYTASIIELLHRLGMGNLEVSRKALEWLRAMQNPDGTYPAREGSKPDADPTTSIAFLMRELYGADDDVYKRGEERFEEYLARLAEDAQRGHHLWQGRQEENDIYHLTHLLSRSVIKAGYDLRDPRVRKIVAAICNTQREDGGWRVFWTQASEPAYSAYALELLVYLGALPQDDLTSMTSFSTQVPT